MNEAHWHLAVNHFPIIFPIVGVIVMLTALLIKAELVKRTACMIFILGALAAMAATNSGEKAEEMLSKIEGFNEQYIEVHEESAEIFAILSYSLGGLSLLAFWLSLKQKKISNSVNYITLIVAFVVLFFGRETVTTGGEIRHTEIRGERSTPHHKSNIKSIRNNHEYHRAWKQKY